ncbi:MAG: ABC transporter permease [Acidobacteriota bacterium]|nr:ABC transporter permease [Blastocatellia bacterium]MDW8411996.1 ABC transporter permease [Acidobacteriota bacterium]
MRLTEVIKMALSAILAHKLRSFLTLLGIIFGVATVIAVVSLIEGFNRYVDEKIADIGTNAFRVQKFSIEDFSSVKAFDQARKRNKDIRMEDYFALANAGGKIKTASVKAYNLSEIKRDNEVLFEVRLTGATANVAEIDRIDLGAGRYFTAAENEKSQFVCVIGADIKTRLFAYDDPLGKYIKIDGRPFRVIGVTKPRGSVFGQSQDKFVDIPINTFLNIYGPRRSLLVSVVAIDEASYEDAIDQARVILRNRRKLRPNEPDNFGILTPAAINRLRAKIFGTIQIAAIGVTSISLIVGGIVIMNIMLISVIERTKEIGIRKSLGARRSDILGQILAESTILALTGGLIGVSIAYGLAKLVSATTPIPTALPITAVAIALVASSSVGLISGLYPAWRAASVDPIVALRAE